MGKKSSVKAQRRLAKAAKARMIYERSAAGRARGCLFCRMSDGGFTTQEHVMPESMGNKEIVLPNGVVCDRCNNRSLSVLDQALCDFMPIKVLRTMLGVQSKTGHVPVTKVSTGVLKRSDEGVVIVEVNGSRDNRTICERSREDGRRQLRMELAGGNRMTPRYCATLSRALLKQALESAWLDHGELTLDHPYDHVRDAVLGHQRDGFLLLGRRADVERADVSVTYGMVHYGNEDQRMWVTLEYLGVVLATDSRLAEPPPEVGAEQALVFRFGTSDERGAA